MPDERKFIMFRGPGGLLCRPHVNSELEVIVVTDGVIDVTVGGNVISAKKNEAVLILPYEMHAFSPIGNSHGRVYMFSFQLVESFYDRYGGGSIESGKFSLPRELSEYLSFATPHVEESPDEFSAKSLFFPLVSEFLKTNPISLARNKHTLSVRRIADYVHENITEKISLKSASQALGISSASLSTILKEYIGLSFTDFVNNLRLEKAVHLLYDCDISITEAAYLSGFGSIRNFNRIFYDTLGITPSEYKKTKT
ncbi:MAG: helix-turn-helix transcriptional regulator [Oscillospiraceae bacterium]|nr:helix-turn-helix transcriptional regulator [Oscillospiraceae bacterium]